MPKRRTSRTPGASDDAVPMIIEFLLDQTGSMTRYRAETLTGYSDFLATQREAPGTCLFSLTKFSTCGLVTPFVDIDVRRVPVLDEHSFVPDGMTNLRDAICERIANLETRLSTWDVAPRVLFVCLTDGDDNASRRSRAEVRKQIVAATDRGWTMAYLGSHPSAAQAARDMGFDDGNIRTFEQASTRETMTDLGVATATFRATASARTIFSNG